MEITVSVNGKEYKVRIKEITYGEFQEVLKRATRIIGGQVHVDQVALEDGIIEKAIESIEPDVGNVLQWIKNLPVSAASRIVRAVFEVNPFQAQ